MIILVTVLQVHAAFITSCKTRYNECIELCENELECYLACDQKYDCNGQSL